MVLLNVLLILDFAVLIFTYKFDKKKLLNVSNDDDWNYN